MTANFEFWQFVASPYPPRIITLALVTTDHRNYIKIISFHIFETYESQMITTDTMMMMIQFIYITIKG